MRFGCRLDAVEEVDGNDEQPVVHAPQRSDRPGLLTPAASGKKKRTDPRTRDRA
jgi:hypothetical protein